MMSVRLEPAALRSRVKHSTTEPLRSHRKNVLVVRNHTDHFLPFIIICHVAAKKIAAFRPKTISNTTE